MCVLKKRPNDGVTIGDTLQNPARMTPLALSIATAGHQDQLQDRQTRSGATPRCIDRCSCRDTAPCITFSSNTRKTAGQVLFTFCCPAQCDLPTPLLSGYLRAPVNKRARAHKLQMIPLPQCGRHSNFRMSTKEPTNRYFSPSVTSFATLRLLYTHIQKLPPCRDTRPSYPSS